MNATIRIFFFLLGMSFALGVSGAETSCDPEVNTLVIVNRYAHEGAVTVMAVNADIEIDSVIWHEEEGDVRVLPVIRRGGPPFSLEFTLPMENIQSSKGKVEIISHGRRHGCWSMETISTFHRDWGRPVEALFSAWVERLFDGPEDESLSFPSLEPVLRNPDRNFLHGIFGRREDDRLPATPDCADLPYYLRSYFAWKMGLPVAWRVCSRGTPSQAPHCESSAHIESSFVGGGEGHDLFRKVSHGMMDMVHSGTARTRLSDENSDLYPLPLTREALWPGTVYADPYGHVLILVKWVSAGQDHPGILLAADAQPDHSVTRKRFWEGSFLFDTDHVAAGPGFKAFRPFSEHNRLADNRMLLQHYDVAPYSDEQAHLDREDFYIRMAGLINPQGLTPATAYQAMHEALIEQLKSRVISVDNGERYMRSHPGSVVSMPVGAAVFQTLGAWEDFATPSRDMRLLIALSVMAHLPAQVRQHPELFRLGTLTPEEASQQIEAMYQRQMSEDVVSYLRSDGSTHTLTLGDVMARRTALEMAYNPNDCVEIRWGAAPDSDEARTCQRRAPFEQRQRMETYRGWFRDMKRPG